jgi:nucleotide-binding universal stress UspA family protein
MNLISKNAVPLLYFCSKIYQMKKIVVAVDFSDVSSNAAAYAIALAKTTGASVTLLHVFHLPSINTEALLIPDLEQLEKENEIALSAFEKELCEKYPNNLQITNVARAGFLADELKDYVKETNAGLIVMGITGAGRFEELLFGSNATSMMEDAACPVMIIPAKATYTPIKSVAFACDYKNDKRTLSLAKIKEFVKMLGAKLSIINFLSENEGIDLNKATIGINIDSYFEELSPKLFFHKAIDGKIAEEIDTFIHTHKIDVLIMVPRKHSFLSNLLHASTTKKMAFQTPIPLLTIHE